ncbi:hypothetical protein [Streptomyces sp. NPDC056358]
MTAVPRPLIIPVADPSDCADRMVVRARGLDVHTVIEDVPAAR